MNRLFQKVAPPPPPAVAKIIPPHPFYPIGIEIANYIANDRNVLEMLTLFFSGWVVILGSTWYATGKFTKLRTMDRTVLLWFVLSMSQSFWEQEQHTDRTQLEPFTFSLKDISRSIMPPWDLTRICLVNCGKNMRILIPDILPPTHSYSVWRLSPQYVLSQLDLNKLTCPVHVGTTQLCYRILDPSQSSSTTPHPRSCLYRSDVW